jgi:hypothetical protein
MGAVHPAADLLHLAFSAVDDGVNVGERVPKPVHRPFNEAGVLGHALADRRVGELQQDGAARPGEQNAFCAKIGLGGNHVHTIPEQTAAREAGRDGGPTRRRTFPSSDATVWRTRLTAHIL